MVGFWIFLVLNKVDLARMHIPFPRLNPCMLPAKHSSIN